MPKYAVLFAQYSAFRVWEGLMPEEDRQFRKYWDRVVQAIREDHNFTDPSYTSPEYQAMIKSLTPDTDLGPRVKKVYEEWKKELPNFP